MFTGIVREVGSVAIVAGGDDGVQLEIEAPEIAPLVEIGGSVAINGGTPTLLGAGVDKLPE